MRVAFLTREAATVASARVRIGQYLGPLRALGVEDRVREWDVRSRPTLLRYAADAIRLARWADVTVVQKPRLPVWLLRSITGASPLVVDFDDALWARSDPAAAHEFGERLEAALARSRGTVAGSHHLAEWARPRTAAEVTVIPSSVDLDAYAAESESRSRSGSESAPGGVVTLGWIGSAPNLADFTDEVRGALHDLAAEVPVRMSIISSEPVDLPGIDVELVAWSLATEARALAAIDIGLMPLRDDERSRGRCSFKAVQYMAASRPVVASAVGSATEVVVDGETGRVVTGRQEWLAALRELVDDVSLRRRLGHAGRERVEAQYSVQANVGRWMGVLERARER